MSPRTPSPCDGVQTDNERKLTGCQIVFLWIRKCDFDQYSSTVNHCVTRVVFGVRHATNSILRLTSSSTAATATHAQRGFPSRRKSQFTHSLDSLRYYLAVLHDQRRFARILVSSPVVPDNTAVILISPKERSAIRTHAENTAQHEQWREEKTVSMLFN